MDADSGAVIGPACRDAGLPCCSILLTYGNFTNPGSLDSGSLAALVAVLAD